MERDHVAEAQLAYTADHELEPFFHQLLRHERAVGEAISFTFRRWPTCQQWTAVRGAVAVQNSILVKHEMTNLMIPREELHFVTR